MSTTTSDKLTNEQGLTSFDLQVKSNWNLEREVYLITAVVTGHKPDDKANGVYILRYFDADSVKRNTEWMKESFTYRNAVLTVLRIQTYVSPFGNVSSIESYVDPENPTVELGHHSGLKDCLIVSVEGDVVKSNLTFRNPNA